MDLQHFEQHIRKNCDISDARDNGIYSMCTLFLRLRNLYKWEHGLSPWDEPSPPVLLEWIEAREGYWARIRDEEYSALPIGAKRIDPFAIEEINAALVSSTNLLYGAGYGRSLKAVFFLGHKEETLFVEGFPVHILGHEEARELASPFAMQQDRNIYFRLEPFRFFLWDRIMDGGAQGRKAMAHSLAGYGVVNAQGQVDREKLIKRLHFITREEAIPIIHHEIGELLEDTFHTPIIQKLIAAFPDSAVELVVRSIKDILADIHPLGMLSYIIVERRPLSLGFYISFLDGMRRALFPEILPKSEIFFQDGKWEPLEEFVRRAREIYAEKAEDLVRLAAALDSEGPDWVRQRIAEQFLHPLGLKGAA